MHLPSDADISGRDLGEEELELLRKVLESGMLHASRGSQTRLFEKEFADRMGVGHACAVNSGSAAILTALAALNLGPGDHIITTPLLDPAHLSAVLFSGAAPVFADIDPLTLTITPASVAASMSSRTRAILAVHSLGRPCDVDAIRAAVPDTPIIEDCSHAPLARLNGRLTGNLGDIAVFSFHQSMHMTTGEGGITITNEPGLAARMLTYASPGDSQPGLSLRMTELIAAVARTQLCKLEGYVVRRRRAAERLSKLLIGCEGVTVPLPSGELNHVYWKYPILVDPEVIPGGAAAFAAELNSGGLPPSPDVLALPAFAVEQDLPGASGVCSSLVLLPWNEFYNDNHVDHIASQIHGVIAKLACVLV